MRFGADAGSRPWFRLVTASKLHPLPGGRPHGTVSASRAGRAGTVPYGTLAYFRSAQTRAAAQRCAFPLRPDPTTLRRDRPHGTRTVPLAYFRVVAVRRSLAGEGTIDMAGGCSLDAVEALAE